MRKLFARYEALLFAALMVVVFVIGATAIMNNMSVFSNAGSWKTDFSKHNVPLDDIIVGGMGRDGIAPIDNPRFETVTQAATWLGDYSPVIVVEISGEVRAYPLAVLIKHEIVNDQIAGEPIAATFCPLCHSPVVYSRRLDDQVLRLGVSGNLYNSGFVMWDDITESWWMQFTGQAIVGDYTGRKLTMIPSQVVGFSTFAGRYPDGMVLAGDATKPDMHYGRNPYINYDTNPDPLLYMGQSDPRLFPTGRVLAAKVNGQPIAYPFDVISRVHVVNHEVRGVAVVAMWQPGALSALDNATIDLSRDVGMAALFKRYVGGQVLTFYYERGMVKDYQTDSVWNIFGEAVMGDLAGIHLEQIDSYPHFWFAWATAYPDTLIYGR